MARCVVLKILRIVVLARGYMCNLPILLWIILSYLVVYLILTNTTTTITGYYYRNHRVCSRRGNAGPSVMHNYHCCLPLTALLLLKQKFGFTQNAQFNKNTSTGDCRIVVEHPLVALVLSTWYALISGKHFYTQSIGGIYMHAKLLLLVVGLILY